MVVNTGGRGRWTLSSKLTAAQLIESVFIHETQRSPRAHPELAQLTTVQSVGRRATWTHLKHLGTRAEKEVTFRVTTRG